MNIPIDDRACDLEDAVMAAGREPEATHCGGKEALGLRRGRAEAPDLAGRHLGVHADARSAEALPLGCARPADARAELGRAVGGGGPDVGPGQGRQLGVGVDP